MATRAQRANPALGRVEVESPSSTAAALFATKLHVPANRPTLVSRSRLLSRLRSASLPKLTLVDAPPGWGKTTLLADWRSADERAHRFAWLALDPGDNDPARFWTYLVGALRTVEPELGADALASLRVPGANVVGRVLPALINEAGALSDPVVLVLDDYHVIVNAEIHEAFAPLLDHSPPTLRIVIATRSDPPLPVGRLRAAGEMLEIRAEELRFSEEEAVTLLNGRLGLELATEDIGLLQQRTEGWAAGLYLAALSLHGQSDPRRFIEAFAGDDRHVVDYLGVEVLAGQPDDVRTFLLRTSILDRLCGPLCDAVTGTGGSAAMLERIERSNLFLVPLDAKRRWYRYHHLFGELLRYELHRAEPQHVPDLHNQASAWYRDGGSIHEAIHHATAAGDVAGAADMIALHWSSYLQEGQLSTVAGWLDVLPPGAVSGDPRLCLTRAWIAVNEGWIDEVDRWIEAAQRATPRSTGDDAVSLEAAAGMLRCIHRYMEGDVGQAIEAAQQARELEPAETSPWRSVGCPVLGVALFWRGATPDAQGELEAAAHRAEPAGNNIAVIHAHSCLAAIHAERGQLSEAEQLARTALHLGEQRNLAEHWATTMAHVARAKVLEESGQHREAEAEAARAVELSRRGVARLEIAYALLAHAQARHDLGDREGAQAVLRDARRAVEACHDPGIVAGMLARTERRVRVASGRAAAFEDGLSEREFEVLRLLPGQLSLREVAATLYVSLNTVKTHTRAIYRKLDASSRAEAVARAREVGLL